LELNLVTDDSSLPDRIIWIDETIFKLNGHINRHNCVYDAVENPYIVITQEMNTPGVIVWVIGSFFFDGTVTAHSYLEKLNKEIVPAIESQTNLRKMFYMHDGALAHYAQSIRDFLDRTFPNRWIDRHGPIDWPARSLDWTATASFLWGLIKDRQHQRACHSVPERLQICKDVEGEHIEQFL
jgi:hypothetical protein